MSYMFENCISLKTILLLDTSNIINMVSIMYYGCTTIEKKELNNTKIDLLNLSF